MTVDSVIASVIGTDDFAQYEQDLYEEYQEKAEREIIAKLNELLFNAAFLTILEQWGGQCACRYKEHREITIRLKSGKSWKIRILLKFQGDSQTHKIYWSWSKNFLRDAQRIICNNSCMNAPHLAATTKNDIQRVLDCTRAELEPLSNPQISKSLRVLYNLVEKLLSENEELKTKNHKLQEALTKQEIYRPTGNTNTGDISSDKDRIEVSKGPEDDKDGYRLNDKTIENLKKQSIPVEVIEKLGQLENHKYEDKPAFEKAIEDLLGKTQKDQYIELLLKHAHYRKRNRTPKLSVIHIDRKEICKIDQATLPADAVPKGHESKTVQDLIIKTDNVEFKREVYYSPSERKTFLAEVPKGYEGEYGPHFKANIITMKYVCNMSLPKILELVTDFGIVVSGSYLSRRLTKHMDVFLDEKKAIYRAMLESTEAQHTDDTRCNVNGESYYTQIVCNQYATVFFTTKQKDRLTILDVLRNFEPRQFIFNDEAFSLLTKLKASKKLIMQLTVIEQNIAFSEQEIEKKLDLLGITGPRNRTKAKESSAIAFYHQDNQWPVIQLLIADDAPQFKLLTSALLLCWIHECRHYKRLTPFVDLHKEELNGFIKAYWELYKTILAYKVSPTDEKKAKIAEDFDALFSKETGYDELDARIEKTKKKKVELLAVLDFPKAEAHNNRAELGARVQKRREDVSLQTKTTEGTNAKDIMMTVVETCKKLGVSSYRYIYDRINNIFGEPSLAELITKKAAAEKKYQDSS